MNTAKKSIRHLAKICSLKGVRYAVISPGSRNAPLISAFLNEASIECCSIVDERCAAFFALGIAQQTAKPVALICTSGSAVLNFAPAIAEAYYQKIPLLVITADRPHEWIDQGENQSIVQSNIYQNYIKKSFQLPLEASNQKDQWYSDRLINEAINSTLYPEFGPVHINVPLREPLYDLVETTDAVDEVKIIEQSGFAESVSQQGINSYQKEWQQASKKMIIVGAHSSQKKLNDALAQLCEDKSVIVLRESMSNVELDPTIHISMVDACIEYVTANDDQAFIPDLIVTIGGGIVSKKLKFLFRSKHINHWHVSPSGEHWDTFQNLSQVIQQNPITFLAHLKQSLPAASSKFQEQWLQLQERMKLLHGAYLGKLAFCDFTVFDYLLRHIPAKSNIHFGNSTPIRYANLFPYVLDRQQNINANRGVSGIDGVTSTASGAAFAHPDQLTFCITGDIAFLYDSNALWNKQLPKNLKIIIINNGGGNIFRIIPGPMRIDRFEEFMETQQQVHFENICKAYDVDFFTCNDLASLQQSFAAFINNKERSSVLEIATNNEVSAEALKNYFTYLIKNYEQ